MITVITCGFHASCMYVEVSCIISIHLLLDRCLLCEVFEGRSLTIKQLSIAGQFVLYKMSCWISYSIIVWIVFLHSYLLFAWIVVGHQTFLNKSCILMDIMSCFNVEFTVRIIKSRFIEFLSKNFSRLTTCSYVALFLFHSR